MATMRAPSAHLSHSFHAVLIGGLGRLPPSLYHTTSLRVSEPPSRTVCMASRVLDMRARACLHVRKHACVYVRVRRVQASKNLRCTSSTIQRHGVVVVTVRKRGGTPPSRRHVDVASSM